MNKCKNCGKETLNPKFCSMSCSASFNNKGTVRNRDTSIAIAALKSSAKKYIAKTCPACGDSFVHHQNKTCSARCAKDIQSQKATERLKDPNYRKDHYIGRGQRSYLERSFSEWLLQQNITFQEEVSFRNVELNRTYFADFVLPKTKVIIELDGSQHANTAIQDAIRDSYIENTYGYKVYRITHSEYRNKSKLLLIQLLVAREAGVEPA